MSSPSKRKGSGGEREFARLVGGKRVPLSGAHPDLPGDVVWPGMGTGECKRRRDGFRQLYQWLDGADWLAVRADRRDWLVVMRLEDVKRLLGDDDIG